MKSPGVIKIKGARTHNLKNINLEIPRDKMTVFTGLSGSGKSSLAFDTIFAEGQRRYVESLSAYARQFIDQMQKPDVDEIEGLSPAISIDQKTRSSNPRSTVATLTEIYDYLRIFYARIGRPHCLICGQEIKKLSPAEIVALIQEKVAERETAKIRVYAPLVRGRKGEYYQLLYDLLDKGYSEVLVDGKRQKLRERIVLSRHKKHEIDVLIDELATSDAERLSEAVERALGESEGLVRLIIQQQGRSLLFSARFACPNDGFSYPEVEPRLFSFNSPYGACPTCHGLGTKHLFGDEPCDDCGGARLRPEALHVFVGSKNIVDFTALSIGSAAEFFEKIKLTPKEREIAKVIIKEIESRLQFLLDVGLDYITLDRRAHTLSGGESQRIRLASQLGSRLVGALYVLDEPTIGLHPRDNERLLKTLHHLRDLGNTIIVVEHDEDTILASDFLVDIGPGAGVHGGKIVAADETEKLILGKTKSLTLEYLRGERTIALPEKVRQSNKGALKIRGGNIFNIKNLNLDLPLGRLVALTGVSGSGKSSLLYEILYKNLQARLERRYRSNEIFHVREFGGTEYLNRVIMIDQAPIGRTPRSNPATYTGAWTYIRDLFAATEGARLRGWSASRFSFNIKGGRCEACQGNGTIAVEMLFLPTVYVECDVCHSQRFDKETLAVKYRDKNISEVLKLTVEEALELFNDIPNIYDRLKTMVDVGLGYLELGQSATTLSGGEAQRVKISSELYRPQAERTIYLLDEPTVGLHYEDVNHLIKILSKLADRGNTVVIIEHNLDLIKNADYLIDLGPEGGDRGGQIPHG
ncbi:MAG: excinuclease ABC subunit UvrA [Candidatus Vogelbacteria bacterium]|nr:excinuclease ABC subunit UvrA [Candidatus Vogelbacteria bacterium]